MVYKLSTHVFIWCYLCNNRLKNIHKLLEKKIRQKIPQVLTKMTLNAINYKMLTQFLDE